MLKLLFSVRSGLLLIRKIPRLLSRNKKMSLFLLYRLQKNHGAPTDAERHAGDLGNILTLSGTPFTPIMISDPQLSLDPNSEAFVGGRAIVIHGGEDDLGRGGNSLENRHVGTRFKDDFIQVQNVYAKLLRVEVD